MIESASFFPVSSPLCPLSAQLPDPVGEDRPRVLHHAAGGERLEEEAAAAPETERGRKTQVPTGQKGLRPPLQGYSFGVSRGRVVGGRRCLAGLGGAATWEPLLGRADPAWSGPAYLVGLAFWQSVQCFLLLVCVLLIQLQELHGQSCRSLNAPPSLSFPGLPPLLGLFPHLGPKCSSPLPLPAEVLLITEKSSVNAALSCSPRFQPKSPRTRLDAGFP